MANQWFKFYGGEYLSDPKIGRLTPAERSCWITILSMASMTEDGIIKFLEVEDLLYKSGIKWNPYNEGDYEECQSILVKLSGMKMIDVNPDKSEITLTNWKKRQETALSVAERVAKHRKNKLKQAECNENVTERVTNVTTEENRIEENREKESVEDSAPLSEKNLKPKPNSPRGWANLRREEIGKPPIRTPRSEKQVETFEALKWKDYFRDQGYEQHGMQFFKVESKKRESAVSILIIKASKEVEDMKKLIDWWFEGNGEWAQYEPEQCFMGKTLERFINRNKGTKQNKPLSL